MQKNGKVLKALVVEDQELFRQAVADELSFFGFETVTAVDGEDGLRAALAEQFDLILSDIRMPNKDGKWFLNELRKVQKSAPAFIFMTGFTDLSPQDAYDMGAEGFIAKPLNSDRLNALLAKVCRPLASRWIDKPQSPPVQHFVVDTSASAGSSVRVALGRGGAFLSVDNMKHKVGDVVSFDLKLSEGPIRHLEGLGTIVWRRENSEAGIPGGYGIEFDYLAPSSLAEWLAYLGVKEIVSVIPTGRKQLQSESVSFAN